MPDTDAKTSKPLTDAPASDDLDHEAAGNADELLASMADEAIDQLMRGEEAGDVEADLTDEEAAALADDEGPVAARAPEGGSFADVQDVMGVTSVPTDEELDALLRATPAERDNQPFQQRRPLFKSPPKTDPIPVPSPSAETAPVEAKLPNIASELAEDEQVAGSEELPVADEPKREPQAEVSPSDADDAEEALASGDGIVADDALEERTHDVAEKLEVADVEDADDIATEVEPEGEHVSIAETVAMTTAPGARPIKTESPVEQKPSSARRGNPVSALSRLAVAPLVWLNAPLAHHPVARDAVGKVALVTTLNASAVIAYVMLLR